MSGEGARGGHRDVAGVRRETGGHANLLLLACQGLLGAERSVVNRDDVERVWGAERSAQPQTELLYWKEDALDSARWAHGLRNRTPDARRSSCS